MPQKVHVLLRKEEIEPAQLQDKAVVVLDVLFATTTMAAALSAGCTEVLPMADGEAARAAAAAAPDAPLLAGEWMAETLPGFGGATPLEVLAQPLEGRRLVYATTNGTVALVRAAQGAAAVYAAALVNAAAVADRLLRTHPQRTVVLVCAGSAGRFNLEDAYGAGCLVSLLRAAPGRREFTDAALAAEVIYRQGKERAPGTAHPLWQAGVGRRMLARGREEDLFYAARENVLGVVPRLVAGRLRAE